VLFVSHGSRGEPRMVLFVSHGSRGEPRMVLFVSHGSRGEPRMVLLVSPDRAESHGWFCLSARITRTLTGRGACDAWPGDFGLWLSVVVGGRTTLIRGSSRAAPLEYVAKAARDDLLLPRPHHPDADDECVRFGPRPNRGLAVAQGLDDFRRGQTAGRRVPRDAHVRHVVRHFRHEDFG